MADDVVSRATVVFSGVVHWPPKALPVKQVATPQATKSIVKAPGPTPEERSAKNAKNSSLVLIALAVIFVLLGRVAPAEFLSHFTVFVLACFIGWQLVWNVAHALHTPLMSVTNAISGIILVGGLLQVRSFEFNALTVLSFVAILVATINIAGGFYVTHRMLKMFRR